MLAGNLERTLRAATIVDKIAFDGPATKLFVEKLACCVLFANCMLRARVDATWIFIISSDI